MRKDLQEIITVLEDINSLESEVVRVKLFNKMIETDTALLKLEIAYEYAIQENLGSVVC